MKKYIKIDRKSMPEMLKKKNDLQLQSIYEITVCILHAAYITAILCLISEYTMEITSQLVYKHSSLNLVIYIQSK